MINAFLISGAPRTLVIDEMIIYYKNLIDYYLQKNITLHFYIILKLDENISDFKAPYERFINLDVRYKLLWLINRIIFALAIVQKIIHIKTFAKEFQKK